MMSKSYQFFRSKRSLAHERVDPSPDEAKFYEANACPTELAGPGGDGVYIKMRTWQVRVSYGLQCLVNV